MKEINFEGKTFSLVTNTEKGTVNTDTLFEYKQKGKLVTADYYGGSIEYGKIIGTLEGDTVNMLYQCLTTEGVLKAGKAIARISFTEQFKMKLSLQWEWLGTQQESGFSEYIEN